jgi:BolA protein
MISALLSAEELGALLRARLPDLTQLQVADLSRQHAHHAESKKHGGGHFEILAESPKFMGLSRLERSRLVHGLLAPELSSGRIHALSLKLRAPGEAP